MDPWRMRAVAPLRGKHLLPASPPVPIPPPFHVSPPFRSPHLHPQPIPSSRVHPLATSLPKPSPPSHRHSLHPVLLPSSCPPHHPSFVLAPSLQRSPSFPVPAPRPTPAVQPSRHPYPPPSVTFAVGLRPSPPPPPLPPPAAHPSHHPPHPLCHADRRGVCVPQELHRRYEAAPESTKTKALQTVIEMKVHVTPGWCCWEYSMEIILLMITVYSVDITL